MGRHGAPGVGSGAREATASPYIGKHRATEPDGMPLGWAELQEELAELERAEPDDPPRCWSCGHRYGDGCECTCCGSDPDEI